MKEELLHFIWRSKFLLRQPLRLVSGESIAVLNPGIYNRDAGPDFLNAHIRIGETSWYGNVEFHIRSSDWMAHQHHLDKAYDNVILHVVYHHDKLVSYSIGQPIPTLELYACLPPILLKRYSHLQQSKSEIPCRNVFSLPPPLTLQNWLDRLLVSRLERKTETFRLILNNQRNHWEEAFYIYTARYLGNHTNAQPFEWLAERLPLQVITRHKNRIDQLRALCFGVAGFLDPNVKNEKRGIMKYREEYRFLKSKYDLRELPLSAWKFSRTRPSNFPTARLEQWAQFLHASSHLFSKVIAASSLAELKAHYRIPAQKGNLLSEQSIDHLLINSVLPVLFLYGKSTGDNRCCHLALECYESISPENNHIIRFWKSLGVPVPGSSASQALLELKSSYCDALKCVDCAIGQHILMYDQNR